MSISLRDQLLQSGLVQKLKAEAKPEPKTKPPHKAAGKPQRPAGAKPDSRAERTPTEPDLAQAYALRARREKSEREQAEREAQAKAREKKERKEKLVRLLADKALNVPTAELPRNFPHQGKIRRVYCTEEQLRAINAGEIAIVQHLGRFLLVTHAVADEVVKIAPEALLLLVDPTAPAEDDVPADLIW